MSVPVELRDILSSDADVLGGTVCFTKTRIPVRILFDHVNQGVPLEEFLEGYPSVSRSSALRVLSWQEKTALELLEAA